MLMVAYFCGVCGSSEQFRINAKGAFPIIYLVYWIGHSIAVLGVAIWVKVVFDKFPLASFFLKIDQAFYSTVGYVAVHIAFCIFLYCMLKKYHLVEKQAFDARQQIQPVMF